MWKIGSGSDSGCSLLGSAVRSTEARLAAAAVEEQRCGIAMIRADAQSLPAGSSAHSLARLLACLAASVDR